MTNSPPLNQIQLKLKIKGINAVCDPQFPDFYKIKIKTFTFCIGPIPHACPVQLIPKVNKEMSEKSSIYFHFLLKFKTKYWTDFWLRWLIPPLLYNCNNLWKQDAGKSGGQWATQNVTQIPRWRRKKIIIDHASPSSLAYVSIDTLLFVLFLVFIHKDVQRQLSSM